MEDKGEARDGESGEWKIKEKQEMGRVESGDKGEARDGESGEWR